jgi:DNA-binding NarL/FixJ family response regulator
MHSSSIVLLQGDTGLGQSLIASLRKSFRLIRTVRSLDDLRSTVASLRAEVVIVDMEIASFADVAGLSSDFPGIAIVCTHRLADEQMWAAALSMGAADICSSSDPAAILAAVRGAGMKHATAA